MTNALPPDSWGGNLDRLEREVDALQARLFAYLPGWQAALRDGAAEQQLLAIARRFNSARRFLRYRNRIVTRAGRHIGQTRRGSNGWRLQ